MTRPSAACSASRVREWLRISCRTGTTLLWGIRVLSGPTDEVEIGDRTPDKGVPLLTEWGARMPHGVTVTLSVKPGHRRLIQLVQTEFEGRYTIGEGTFGILSAVWLQGDPGPTIVIN